jgi:ATP-binding cassette subfamily C protein LapB
VSQPVEPELLRDAPVAGEDAPDEAPAVADPADALPAVAAPDPLLDALLWLCHHHRADRTPVSLLNGMSVNGPLGPKQAIQLLDGAGFNAALIKRPPGKILSMLLPAILLLKNGDACIVLRRIRPKQRGEEVQFEVLMPGADDGTCMATEEELMLEYSGYALIATPKAGQWRQAAKHGLDQPHWLWSVLLRYVPYYRSAMLAALLSNVLMMATGLFTSVVYDKVIPHKALETMWALGIGAMVAIAFDLAARQLRAHLIDLAGKKADLLLGMTIFRQALNIRLENKPGSSGAFAHQISQIEVVREFMTSATVSALTDLPFIFLFMFMTWNIAGSLVVVLLVAVPTVLTMTWAIQRVLRKLMQANMQQHADLHGVLVEAVEGMEDLRAAGAQGHFMALYEESTAAAASSSVKARGMSSWTNNLTMIMQQLVTVIMLMWGVTLIHEGLLTGGALIGAVMFASRAIAPLSSVVQLATRYQGAKAALTTLDELMATPQEREPGRRYLSKPSVKGQLGLHDVRFAYPSQGRDHAPVVLREVNLDIQPGERVAILGKIGSGKSTILRLLAGLYQPTEGFTEVDEVDLRQIDLADYRTQVGFVSQSPKLFHGTLRDNVMLGRVHADPAHFMEVARQTGLDRIAAAHPMGFDLPVGQGGGLLSGGQRQLVALARCLVTRPKVLLLDEPTSSMDAQAEASFIQHLKQSVGQRTLVVVTHRPALLEVVDRIVVMDAGRVIADGPKAAVLAALAGQPQRPPVAAVPSRSAEPTAMPPEPRMAVAT